jgi:hypothetical protein
MDQMNECTIAQFWMYIYTRIPLSEQKLSNTSLTNRSTPMIECMLYTFEP